MKFNKALLAGAIVAGMLGGSIALAQDEGAAGAPPAEAPAPTKKDANSCKGGCKGKKGKHAAHSKKKHKEEGEGAGAAGGGQE